MKQAEVDAVLAPGIAGGLEDAHVAEPGDLIEQKEYAAIVPSARLVDGIQERAENDAGGLRARLQDLERQSCWNLFARLNQWKCSAITITPNFRFALAVRASERL